MKRSKLKPNDKLGLKRFKYNKRIYCNSDIYDDSINQFYYLNFEVEGENLKYKGIDL